MTIEELRTRLDELEHEISALVNAFEDETSITIENIRLVKMYGGGEVVTNDVIIEVGI